MKKTSISGSADPLATFARIANFSAAGLLVIFCLWTAEKLHRAHEESDEVQRLEEKRLVQASLLRRFESNAGDFAATVAQYERRMLAAAELPDVQDKLVAIAQENRCNLKRSTPKGSQKLSLGKRGLERKQHTLAARSIEESGFTLHQETLTVSAEGQLEDLLAFLSEIEQQGWLYSANGVTLTRLADEESRISLEMDLVFYDVRPKEDETPRT